MMRNEEKESFMTKKIDFISAENGGIKMYAGVGNVKGWAKTASGIAYTLAAVGISENCYGSSSMDFASEEGFENDGASYLLLKDNKFSKLNLSKEELAHLILGKVLS